MSSRTRRRNRQRRNQKRNNPSRSLLQDVLTVHGEGSMYVSWTSGPFAKGYCDVAHTRPNTVTLANSMPALTSLAALYGSFRVTQLRVKLVPTIPANVGAICAVGWDPALVSGNPHNLNDVLISRHHASCNATGTCVMTMNPSSYFAGFHSTDVDLEYKPMGVLQFISTYQGTGTPDTVVMYAMLSFTIQFAGLRSS